MEDQGCACLLEVVMQQEVGYLRLNTTVSIVIREETQHTTTKNHSVTHYLQHRMVAKVVVEGETSLESDMSTRKLAMKRFFPEKNSDNDVTDFNNLIFQMIEIESGDVEVSNVYLPAKHIDILGYAGAQGRVSPSSPHHEHGNGYDIAKMANGVTEKIYQKENCTIVDEFGNNVQSLKALLPLFFP